MGPSLVEIQSQPDGEYCKGEMRIVKKNLPEKSQDNSVLSDKTWMHTGWLSETVVLTLNLSFSKLPRS